MRYSLCSSLALLTAVCVCKGEQQSSWYPSQDAAWELTFEDTFGDGELDQPCPL